MINIRSVFLNLEWLQTQSLEFACFHGMESGIWKPAALPKPNRKTTVAIPGGNCRRHGERALMQSEVAIEMRAAGEKETGAQKARKLRTLQTYPGLLVDIREARRPWLSHGLLLDAKRPHKGWPVT